MQRTKTDLTEGNIFPVITKLALPIMGSSFIQMAFSLFDMKFVGSLGYKAVSAVGTASFFLMLSQGLIMLLRVGAEVHVSQSLGRKDEEAAANYATVSVQLAVILGILYLMVGLLFRDKFIAFFNLRDPQVIEMAESYMTVLSFAIPILFLNFLLTGILNAGGYSEVPFTANLAGVVVKIFMSYCLINGAFGLPRLGTVGSAAASILAYSVTFIILIFYIRSKKDRYLKFEIFAPFRREWASSVIKTGGPAAIQSLMFSLISVYIGRIVAVASVEAVAVQRVGAQIESVSWMTASGFSSALSAFTGQNYGAGKYRRVIEGFIKGSAIVGGIGLFATFLLMVFPRQLFSVFIPEPEHVVTMGVEYLVILGISQFFQSLEISTNGAFNGVGLTQIPSVSNTFFQIMRIPAALFLMNTSLGINGIWWAISISTVFKGIVGVILFYLLVIKRLNRGVPLKKEKNPSRV